jgi:hypothetical protein
MHIIAGQRVGPSAFAPILSIEYGVADPRPGSSTSQGDRAVQSDSAPALDGDRTKVAGDQPEVTGDPVRHLLDGPPALVRLLRLRHWAGLLALVAAVGVTAFVIPPMLSAQAPAALSPQHPQPPSRTPSAAAPGLPAAAASSPAPSVTAPPATTPGPASAQPTGAAQPTAGRSSATATPRHTTPAGVVFTPISVQAEASGNTLSEGAAEVDCATCDGGARVRWVGRVDVHLTVPVAGTRKITIECEVNGTRSFDVSINGDPVALVKVTGTDWSTPRSATATASIPAGSVDIGLYGDAGNAPDFDKITIG